MPHRVGGLILASTPHAQRQAPSKFAVGGPAPSRSYVQALAAEPTLHDAVVMPPSRSNRGFAQVCVARPCGWVRHAQLNAPRQSRFLYSLFRLLSRGTSPHDLPRRGEQCEQRPDPFASGGPPQRSTYCGEFVQRRQGEQALFHDF